MMTKHLLLLSVVFLFVCLAISAQVSQPSTSSAKAPGTVVYSQAFPSATKKRCDVKTSAEAGFYSSYTDEELGFRYYGKPVFQTDVNIEVCASRKISYGADFFVSQSINGKINDGSEVEVNPFIKFKFTDHDSLKLQGGNFYLPGNLRITNLRADYTHNFQLAKKVEGEFTETISFYSTNDREVPGGIAQITEFAITRDFDKFSLSIAPVFALSNSPYYGPSNRTIGVGGIKVRTYFPVTRKVSFFIGGNIFKQMFGPGQPIGGFTPVIGLSFN